MANNIDVNLKVSDNGTLGVVDNKVKQTTSNIKAMKQAAAQTSGIGAGGAGNGQELKDYGVSRGAVGTGAGGRDFAQQAQGLGGLVHVYATFAANVFAVGAAFTLLDKAMNIERMQQAADVISAHLGVDMKGLAKDLVAATDGALNFNTAMQVALRASSTGETAKQIKDLVTIAKGASVAMGISLDESIQRITQGTAKQEKKILDDLGIIIKASDAYKTYASEHNIAVTALTAYQKQQAFTEAVAIQGMAKFAETAKLATSPLDKFLSTLQQVGIGILTFVNKGLSPIANFLSENSGAMLAILTALVAYLLNKAVPALKDFGQKFEQESAKNLSNLLEQQKQYYANSANASSDKLNRLQADLVSQKQLLSSAQQDVLSHNSAIADSLINNASKSNKTIRDLSDSIRNNAEVNSDLLVKSINRSIGGLKTQNSLISGSKGMYAPGGIKENTSISDKTVLIAQNDARIAELVKVKNDELVKSVALRTTEAEITGTIAKIEANIVSEQSASIMLSKQQTQELNNTIQKYGVLNNTLTQKSKFAQDLQNSSLSAGQKISSFFSTIGGAFDKDNIAASTVKMGEALGVISDESVTASKSISIFGRGMQAAKVFASNLFTVMEGGLAIVGSLIGYLAIVTIALDVLGTIYYKLNPAAKAFSEQIDLTSKSLEDLQSKTKVANDTLKQNSNIINNAGNDADVLVKKYQLLNNTITGIIDSLHNNSNQVEKLLTLEPKFTFNGAWSSFVTGLESIIQKASDFLDKNPLQVTIVANANPLGIASNIIKSIYDKFNQSTDLAGKALTSDQTPSSASIDLVKQSLLERVSANKQILAIAQKTDGITSSQIEKLAVYNQGLEKQAKLFTGENMSRSDLLKLNTSIKTQEDIATNDIKKKIDLNQNNAIIVKGLLDDSKSATQAVGKALLDKTDATARSLTSKPAADFYTKYRDDLLNAEKLQKTSPESARNIIAGISEDLKTNLDPTVSKSTGEVVKLINNLDNITKSSKKIDIKPLLDGVISVSKTIQSLTKVPKATDTVQKQINAQQITLLGLTSSLDAQEINNTNEKLSLQQKYVGYQQGSTIELLKQQELNKLDNDYQKSKLEIAAKLFTITSNKSSKPQQIAEAKAVADKENQINSARLVSQKATVILKDNELQITSDILRYTQEVFDVQKRQLALDASNLNGLIAGRDISADGLITQKSLLAIKNLIIQQDKIQEQIDITKANGLDTKVLENQNKELQNQINITTNLDEQQHRALQIQLINEKNTNNISTANKLLDDQISGVGALGKAMGINVDLSASINANYKEQLLAISAEKDSVSYLAKTQALQVQYIEDQNAAYDKQLEIQKKQLSAGQTPTDSAGNQVSTMQVLYDQAKKLEDAFRTTIPDYITHVFDELYKGMDDAISALVENVFTNKKFTIGDFIKTFDATVAAESRKMLSQQLSLYIKETVTKIFTGKDIVTKDQRMENYAKDSLDTLKSIDRKTPDNGSGVPTATDGASASDIALKQSQDTANGQLSIFTDLLGGMGKGLDSVLGTSGTFGRLLSSMGGGLDRLINSLMSSLSSGSSGSGVGDMLGGIFGKIFGGGGNGSGAGSFTDGGVPVGGLTSAQFLPSLLQSANGNVMTQYGPLKLNAFAKGGITNGPVLSLIGEGHKNEAYVPLPDGRSIPVTMKQDTKPQVNVTNHFIIQGNMNTETQEQIAFRVGMSINKAVGRNG